METKEVVEMTAEEKAEFEQFKKEKEKRLYETSMKNEREEYKTLVNDSINDAFPKLVNMSGLLSRTKTDVMNTFQTAIKLKVDLFKVKDNQRSHTFSNEKGDKRITVGFRTIDGYLDTVNEGVEIVKEVVSSLAKDEESKVLVAGILKLLSKDQTGSLKPSRILQLRKMAMELKDTRLQEGVQIIEEAYAPTVSKTYIKAEHKGKNGAWVNVALGITES